SNKPNQSRLNPRGRSELSTEKLLDSAGSAYMLQFNPGIKLHIPINNRSFLDHQVNGILHLIANHELFVRSLSNRWCKVIVSWHQQPQFQVERHRRVLASQGGRKLNAFR